ncbi:CusA/CzcA family heavy metal efflux RND transporter [Shewanella oneidensis MR-1]|uniref:Copper/silver efflux pump permease component CusA n=1 Tax=Shewanella oneidensis (strain ATCC 700550 / JCM 31522 / CIP 106686 / LMG 19005 / NCIMB 14063 / MR-1) TaxID=211586 RepID=Q8E8R3_SHEON|nr:CusA/CzcA family heavy metal efflux RND transporter [Shewanella oneidensis]AAN57558.1 copper/silver efflux pump permease component CusA [Shewanella oneidensis MR-1]MDX5998159.1 CusA/CzcA family heavy metal efflux RND transporter [Shewanella oneidensis]MEE2026770.1 Cation efflux system protein CusA [Shewanella oneidensis]QKG94850.1 CusA/CzcA family heavy metal efflux RND transporter [Shewanella oneidensis MR-1]
MLKYIIEASIRQRLMVLIIAMMITLWGVQELRKTPLDALPDLSDVQVIIKTTYPGQAPKLVEEQVTYPLSTAMLAVPGAKTVRGFSMFGDSYVYVIFDDGTDIYWARSRVLEYLSQIGSRLPAGVQPSLGPDASGVGWVFEYALVDRSGNLDLSQLKSLQDWYLKLELQSVAGVSEVATVGGMEQTYQVVLEPDKMAIYKLDIASIKDAIEKSNSEAGGSVVEMAEAEYMVRAKGYRQTLEDFREIPLGIASPSGTSLTLKDVATIRKGPAARRGIAELDGEGEVVGGIIVMRYGENALSTIDAVKAKLEELSAGLPEGVEIVPTYDRSNLILKSVDNLFNKVVEEMLVVGLVCLLFLLHARSTLVAIVTLPLSILIAFIVMNKLGVNANIMSLGGIAIAIGAVVDGAIVMIENLHKHLEQFHSEHQREPNVKEHWRIVTQASTEVGPALFFSLLIITLSFVPVFALEAQEGRLFAPLAYTKSFAMAASAILAITLVPVLMGYFIRGKIPSENKNPISRVLIALYKPALNLVLNFPKITIALALLALVSAWYPFTRMGSEFMPELEEGDLLYMPTALPGISASKAAEVLQQTDRLIKTVPEVARVFGKVGRAETATDPAPLTMLETTIMLKPHEEWREGMTLDGIINQLQQTVKVPGLTNAWVQPIKTRIDMLSTGIKTPVGIKITGADVNELQQLGTQIEAILSRMPHTKSAYAERTSGGRYIDITPKLDVAARYGMNLQDIQDVVRYAIGGMDIGQSVQGAERYPINLRYPRELRDNIEKLRELPVITKSGNYLPLRNLAEIEITEGAPMLASENGRLISWVFIEIEGTSIGEYITSAKQTLSAELNVPPRYSYSFAGQYEYMQRVDAKLKQVIPMALGVIFILLMLTFGSTMQASMIMLSLPFALVGSTWLLYLLDYNISVAVAVGMIALAGVAAEFGVIMLVYLNNAIKHRQDNNTYHSVEDLKEALIEGAVMRIRPKAMTVATIFFGLLPIMWGAGSGNDVMQKIAAPMVGGMVTAPILSLFVLPALYLLVYSRKLKQVA